MDQPTAEEALERLEPLVGEWTPPPNFREPLARGSVRGARARGR